jgi:type VI secretion system secreted protein VgrG
MTDVFMVRSRALPRDARVVGFHGHEGLSQLYAFTIHVTCTAEGFEPDAGVGAQATLALDGGSGATPFLFHGILSELTLVHEMSDRVLVRAVLVPRLWRLTLTHHSRLFTDQSLPDILSATLTAGGLGGDDFSLRLSAAYPPEEHVCQYQESDFDFISRWMEHAGLYYFFEHGDDKETLVITDNRAVHTPLAPQPVRFHASASQDASMGECLRRFECQHHALPASVRLRDHDYAKPLLPLTGSAPVPGNGVGEINVHGARFFSPDAGQRLAAVRAEELGAREVVAKGSGTSFYLRPGYTFTLEDHPRLDATYLATEVEHRGNQLASTPELHALTGIDLDEVYRVDVTAIPATVQFRAPRRTRWPRIFGAEHGTVDGPADSEYAQIDDQGRYKAHSPSTRAPSAPARPPPGSA